jgi:DNA-binding transcriptional MocR family regulator
MAERHGVLLATESPFRAVPSDSGWMRFNVAYSDHPRLNTLLTEALSIKATKQSTDPSLRS